VHLRFAAFQDLAVSLYVPGSSGPATEHASAFQTSYYTPPGAGDLTAQASAKGFSETTSSWYYLDGIDVLAPRSVGAIVAVGDSLTDGMEAYHDTFGLTNPTILNANDRYPDFLARRILARHSGPRFSVINEGIGGNRVLRNGFLPAYGPSLLSRLTSDVIAEPGVADVIVLEGANDLAIPPPAAPAALNQGLKRAVHRLRAAGLNVLLGTLTPIDGTTPQIGGQVPAAVAAVRSINSWIRRGLDDANAVVDFNAALRDPNDRQRLDPRYDSSDHLHPNTLGYQRMAAIVDLADLHAPRCPLSRSG
jgi:lysophospholipase L1-like esterase